MGNGNPRKWGWGWGGGGGLVERDAGKPLQSVPLGPLFLQTLFLGQFLALGFKFLKSSKGT